MQGEVRNAALSLAEALIARRAGELPGSARASPSPAKKSGARHASALHVAIGDRGFRFVSPGETQERSFWIGDKRRPADVGALVYANDGEPASAPARGDGLCLLWPDGRHTHNSEVLEQMGFVIPPASTDVWIAPSAIPSRSPARTCVGASSTTTSGGPRAADGQLFRPSSTSPAHCRGCARRWPPGRRGLAREGSWATVGAAARTRR